MLSRVPLHNKNVIYVAYVGLYGNKETYKYGKSSNFYKREQTHRTNFDKFDIMNVYRTNYKDYVESTFEHELKIRKVHTSLIINSKKQIELFQPNDKYSYDYIMDLLEDIIDEYNYQDRNMMILEYERLQVEKLRLKLELEKLNIKKCIMHS